MHLRHQRTRGVDRSKIPVAGMLANLWRDAMGAVEQDRPGRDLVDRIDKFHSLAGKAFDDIFIMHDFVIDVDARPANFERLIQALDGHVDPGTEPARIG